MKSWSTVTLFCVCWALRSALVCFGDFSATADRHLSQLAEADKFSGTVLVAKGGRVVFAKGYGWANREHDIPNIAETKFRLGSITKPFTAMCILLLESDGKLAVTDPVNKFVEDSPDAWKGITLHHLLTHTSGIPGFTEFPDNLQHERLPATAEKTVNRFRDKPLKFPPGERFNYSNSGYVLLGYIIEKVTGQKYEEVLQEKVFEPLGMKNSGYDHPAKVLPRRAAGYALNNGAIVNCVHFEMDTPHAAGGLYSTVGDLLLWDQALYTEKLLPRETLVRMFTAVKGGYAYGWNTGESSNRRFTGHGGGIAGFRTMLLRYPDDKVTVIVLSNFEMANPEEIAHKLAESFFGAANSPKFK